MEFGMFSGITVGGVRVVDTGLVAYFASTHMISEETANGMKFNFGAVKNTADADNTEVILEVAMAVHENATLGANSLTGTQTVGTVNFGPLGLTVVDNVSLAHLAYSSTSGLLR
jgi:hypothetical protein